MKHVILSVCAGALLIPFAMPAQAQSQYGMAGVPCSQYTKAARGSDILYHQASQWLLGYVSGMNAAMKVAKGTTPLANLANAANEWYASVPKQADPQAAQKDPQDNSLTLSLDRAPKIKPLLDRR